MNELASEEDEGIQTRKEREYGGGEDEWEDGRKGERQMEVQRGAEETERATH